MTKASDNAFPSILITEGTEPSAPAAGKQRIYIDSTSHVPMMTNSSGTESVIGTGNIWSKGTSMPGSPVTNQRVTRTDLGLDFYYDGTRWVSVNLYRDTLGYPGDVLPLTTTGTMGRLTPWFTTYDLWLVAFYTTTYVSTTNNGTNFWTVALNKSDAAAAQTSIVSFSTGTTPDTASNWVQRSTAIGAAYVAASYRLFEAVATKTLTPGSLLHTSSLAYRLIGT